MEKELKEAWSKWYPAAPPIGRFLRYSYAHRWLRVHSLPNGKRYGTSPAEVGEVLRRHNAIATTVLGEGAACFVIVETFRNGEQFTAAAWLKETAEISIWPERWASELSAADEDAPDRAFVVAKAVWRAEGWNELLLEIANDKIDSLLFLSESGHIYAPYDGGADIFCPDPEVLGSWRSEFAFWISRRPDGL